MNISMSWVFYKSIMHASCVIHGPAESFICFVSICGMQEGIATEWPAPALGIPPLFHHSGWGRIHPAQYTALATLLSDLLLPSSDFPPETSRVWDGYPDL